MIYRVCSPYKMSGKLHFDISLQIFSNETSKPLKKTKYNSVVDSTQDTQDLLTEVKVFGFQVIS